MARRISELFFELRAHTEGLKNDLDQSERQLGKWSTFVANNPTAVVGALGVAILGIAVKITAMAAETDKAMRQIAASVPTATAGIDELGQHLDEIAIKAGKTAQEIEAAGVQAAQHGAASAQEVAQIVQAATTFSDATGTALSSSVDLLQQLMREFHLSGDDALKTLATLADVAQTAHVPVDQLLSTFSGASPVFLKFGIDADTGTRAIVALVSAGFGVRQVRQELNKLDGAGIRALAAQVPEATGQLDKLNARAAITEGSLDAIETRIRTKLNVQLKALGTELLPARLRLEEFASQGLGAVIAGLDKIKERKAFLETLAQSTGSPILGIIAGLTSGSPKTAPPKLTIDHEAPPFPFKPPPIAVPLGVAEQKQITDDLAFAQKAVTEFAQSTNQVLAGGTKSAVDNALAELDAFGDKFLEVSTAIRAKIAALPVNAPSSVRDQLQAQLNQLNAAVESGARERLAAIDRLAVQEASSIQATIGKELGELTGNLAQEAGSAITQQNEQLREQILLSDKLSAADKLRLLDNVNLIQLLQQQKNVAVDAVRDVEQTIQSADLAGPTDKSFTEINAKAIELKQTLQQMVRDGGEQAKQGEGYKIIQEAILKLDKERADLLRKLLGINKDVADSTKLQLQTVSENARAIRDAVDGALQLAGAFGLVDEKTVNVLRSVGEIATQIPVLVSQLDTLGQAGGGTLSSVIASALPIAGGIATLVSSILSSGGSKEDAARARALEENTAAIRDLTKHAGLIGASIGITGFDASATSKLLQDIIFGRVGHNDDRSGSATGQISGLTQDQIDQLNAAAKALGISLDGTLHGYQVLAYALDQVTPLLGKFGDSVESMLGELDAEAKILGKSSPLDNLAGILEKLGTKSAGIASIFEGIDTSKALSPDEIATIRQRVQDLFKAMEGGGLTADQLGGLNGDQFLQLLEQIITDLDALGGAAQSAADKLSAAITTTQQSEQIHHVTDPIQQFADKAKDYEALGGTLGNLLKGFDLDHLNPAQIAALDTQLQALFDQLKNSPDSVDLAGLSIDDLIKALLDLDGSATSVANTIKTAAQTIADAESQIAVADDILGATGQQTISELAGAYNIDLSQFDLTTQPGAAAAISFLQDMFKGLDPNDPNYKEKEREIQNLVDRLRGLFPNGGASGSTSSGAGASAGSGTTSAVANAAESLTQVTGNRMADYLATADIHLAELVGLTRQQVSAITLMVASLTRPIITGAILPPFLPSGFGVPRAPTQTTSTAAGGAPQVTIRINRIDVVAPDGTDPAAFADSIGDALLDRLAIKLQAIFAAQYANAQFRAGATLTSA